MALADAVQHLEQVQNDLAQTYDEMYQMDLAKAMGTPIDPDYAQGNDDFKRADLVVSNKVDKSAEKEYPSWVDGAPNLETYLNALNKSNPIVNCQFELVWSRWPRTLFFAKNITIPGLQVNTADLNHAGFTIKIPTHVSYSSQEISINIVADKEGFHYYDLRNMVLQTGHPLVAGDPKATVGNPYGISPDEDVLIVRLRNSPLDVSYHHWTIHNFKPIEIGDIELSMDSSSFVEFEIKGTFTHITYDCGKLEEKEEEEEEPKEDEKPPEEPEPPEEDEDEEENDEDTPPDEPEEPEDLRPPEPPEPPPEPKPTFTSVMSASDSYGTDGDSESQTSSVSEVKMEEPVSDKDMQAAEQCNKELTEASDELENELERIKNMPADPNYTPEHVEDELYNSVHTPNENQQDVPEDSDEEYKGDKVCAAFSTDVTLKSPEQKAAYDAAIAKYNQKTQASMNNFKDTKQQNQQSGNNGALT